MTRQQEVEELRRERDAWRDLAIAQADLMTKVTTAVIDRHQSIIFDTPTLRDALGDYTAVRKQMLTYSRRNPPAGLR